MISKGFYVLNLALLVKMGSNIQILVTCDQAGGQDANDDPPHPASHEGIMDRWASGSPRRHARMAQYQPLHRLKMMTTNQDQTQPTKAQDLLHRAASLMNERGQQYDQRSGERSMQATVTAFNAISGYCLTEADGFLLMAILKMVRDQSREKPHRDSIDDLVAYASLYGEARLHGEERLRTVQQENAATGAELLAQRAKAHQAAQEARYAGR